MQALGSNMSYAIQNTNGEHLGFLLLSGEGENGDCIFRSLPKNPELFESNETKLLYSYQEQGEFQWLVTSDGLKIKHPSTGNTALISGNELNINGQLFKIIKI